MAAEIAADKRVLAVIGRYSSNAYTSVTSVYKKYAIPVVTASAIVSEKEAQNEWYFSVVPDIAFQGSFIANYAIGMLQYKSACIIYEKTSYGTNLSSSFEDTAGKLGIPIHRKWSFEAGNSSAQSEQIMQELLALKDRGIVFVAAGSTESAKIVSVLKSKIPELPIIGSNSFTEDTFINELKKNAPQSASDIYAVSYFIPDIAGETAYLFGKIFQTLWHEAPSPEAACYYDAAHILIEAIRNAEIRGEAGHIRGDRRKVREALAGFYRMENSIGGVTGDIYFDSKGSAWKSLFVVRYENNSFVPAFSQYKNDRNRHYRKYIRKDPEREQYSDSWNSDE
ncbi:MAG: ABC transporter substrate-binding protein [Desulfobacteraceae bacterium]|nr:ABC transporter substrate-binding protein [Desulfobacteraceae bacterium]